MSWSSDHQISQKRVRFEINKGKRSPKGFSASNYDVGNWVFSKFQEFFEKLFGIFITFFENFLELFGIFLELLWNFLNFFFWKFFGNFFGRFFEGLFCEDFFGRNSLLTSGLTCLSRFWDNARRKEGRKEGRKNLDPQKCEASSLHFKTCFFSLQ